MEENKTIEKCIFGNGKHVMDVIITQEEIDGRTFFVARGIEIEVASQGLSLEEALENIKDAAEIVIESSEEAKEILHQKGEKIAPMLTRIAI